MESVMGTAILSPSIDYTLRDQERMTVARNYFDWQSRLARRALGRRVIEVGCGLGNFTERLLDKDLVVALDLEPDCVASLNQRYGSRGNLIALSVDASSETFQELITFEPDSCVCLNVLEHIQNDRAALSNMASVLPRGGRIVLMVPAFQALYGPIDHNLGHYRRYTRNSLGRLATGCGLRVDRLYYMNAIGFFGWWWNAKVGRREEQSPGQIRLFDSVIVPVMSKLEDACPPPFGQSLFAELSKP